MFLQKHTVLAGTNSNLQESVFIEHPGTTDPRAMAEHDCPSFLPRRSSKLPTSTTTIQNECELKSAPICLPCRRFGAKLCEYVPLAVSCECGRCIEQAHAQDLHNKMAHVLPEKHRGMLAGPCSLRDPGSGHASTSTSRSSGSFRVNALVENLGLLPLFFQRRSTMLIVDNEEAVAPAMKRSWKRMNYLCPSSSSSPFGFSTFASQRARSTGRRCLWYSLAS